MINRQTSPYLLTTTLVVLLLSLLFDCKRLDLSPVMETEQDSETIALFYPPDSVRVQYYPNDMRPLENIPGRRVPCPWNRRGLPVFTEFRTHNNVETSERYLILKPRDRITYEFPYALNHRLDIPHWDSRLVVDCAGVRQWVSRSNPYLRCGTGASTRLTITNPSEDEIRIEPGILSESKKKFYELTEVKPRVNVFFIVIDSLRADVVGKYGVTKNLDRLKNDSVSFSSHYVNAAWTRPSTTVFFTGQYASESFINFWDYWIGEDERNSFYQSRVVPLPQFLSQQGMVASMVGNNPFLSEYRDIGVDFGFTAVRDFSRIEDDTHRITKSAVDFLQDHRYEDSPHFFFLNYNDPHKPYNPPTKFQNLSSIPDDERGSMEPRKLDYLGEVAYTDHEVGKFIQFLKDRNLYDDSFIIVTSDHGEVMDPVHAVSLFTGTNTYFGHGQSLHSEDIHVPLLMKFPKFSPQARHHGRSVSTMTQSVDLFPTILKELDLVTPHPIRGKALQDILQAQSTGEDTRTFYGETRSTQAFQKGNWKLMRKSYRFHRLGKFWSGHVGAEPEYLYNLSEDPLEHNPIREPELSRKYSDIAGELREGLDNAVASPSYYTIRVHSVRKEPVRDLEIRLSVGAGTFRPVSGKKYLLVEDKKSSQSHIVFRLNHKDLPEDGSEEFSFQIYPDVAYPKFDFFLNGKPLPDDQWGVGSYDLNPQGCVGEDCMELFQAKSGSPIQPKDFRIQVWRTGIEFHRSVEKDTMGEEAIDILKKQGYINDIP